MERIDAYSLFADIDSISHRVEALIEKGEPLTALINDFNALGEKAKKLEAYALMTKDKELIRDISSLRRTWFFRAAGYNLDIATRQSIANCRRSLYNISRIKNTATTNKGETRLPIALNENSINSLREYLISEKYINHIDIDSFGYWFGYGDAKPNRLRAIDWIESKQLARELLEGLYKDEIKPFARIERITPECFLQGGKPMRLAKPKPVPSTKGDSLKKFLATL